MNQDLITIGLQNPKSASNVASILRASGCYGVSSVFYTGNRYRYAKEFNADTQGMHRRIPTVGVDDLLSMTPKGAQIIAVELVEGATPLPQFQHPQNAFYVFGPEDGSLDQSVVNACHDVVYIPTHGSMNLGATVNVVLYDRLAKSGKFDCSEAFLKQSRDNNNRLKVR